MLIIVVYVPVDHVLSVVEALANAGAGEIGCYRACSFQSVGQGQFQPMKGAEPFIGQVGVLESVEEVRLEMVCSEAAIRHALMAMIAAHPYEVPAYHVLNALTLDDFVS